MIANQTLLVSDYLNASFPGCCMFPDGGVPLPAPNAYTFWDFVGVVELNGAFRERQVKVARGLVRFVFFFLIVTHEQNPGTKAFEWTLDSFRWYVFADTQQPAQFCFGSGGCLQFTKPLQASLPPQVLALPASCQDLERVPTCPFCWFDPDCSEGY